MESSGVVVNDRQHVGKVHAVSSDAVRMVHGFTAGVVQGFAGIVLIVARLRVHGDAGQRGGEVRVATAIERDAFAFVAVCRECQFHLLPLSRTM